MGKKLPDETKRGLRPLHPGQLLVNYCVGQGGTSVKLICVSCYWFQLRYRPRHMCVQILTSVKVHVDK